jgi:hypothetical protein
MSMSVSTAIALKKAAPLHAATCASRRRRSMRRISTVNQ